MEDLTGAMEGRIIDMSKIPNICHRLCPSDASFLLSKPPSENNKKLYSLRVGLFCLSLSGRYGYFAAIL